MATEVSVVLQLSPSQTGVTEVVVVIVVGTDRGVVGWVVVVVVTVVPGKEVD